MIKICRTILWINLLFLVAVSVQAQNWPNWRGPNYNGSSSAENLPTEWSKTDNVVWVTPLPGQSAATPAIWEDKIFVSSLDESSEDLLALCLDRNSGNILWQKVTGTGHEAHRRNNNSSPSPVTDGKYVYFFYGNGILVCFDFDGNEIWKRKLEEDYGEFSLQFGYANSPLLYKDKLYILVLQRNSNPLPSGEMRESFLLALDPKTGDTLWKHVRPSDARRESYEAYTTPIPNEVNGREEIIIHGGDYTTGHNPNTGKEIWRWGSYNPTKIRHWRIIPSPVTGGGKIYVAAPKRAPLYAINEGMEGNVPLEKHAWKYEEYPPDVCTPLFYNDDLFVFDGDRAVMTRIEPENGQILWEGNMGRETVFRASPTAADGKIYCINEDGLVVVMDAKADEYKELFRITMGEGPCRASIPLSDGSIYIRTAEKLYRIGTK